MITVVSIHLNKSNLTRHLFTHFLLWISFSNSFTLTFNFVTFLSCLLFCSSYQSLCCSATLILLRRSSMISVDRRHISLLIHYQICSHHPRTPQIFAQDSLRSTKLWLSLLSHTYTWRKTYCWFLAFFCSTTSLAAMEFFFFLYNSLFGKKFHFIKWNIAYFRQKYPLYFYVHLTCSLFSPLLTV